MYPLFGLQYLTWDIEGDHGSGVTIDVYSKRLVRQNQLLGVLRGTQTVGQLTEMIVFIKDGMSLFSLFGWLVVIISG